MTKYTSLTAVVLLILAGAVGCGGGENGGDADDAGASDVSAASGTLCEHDMSEARCPFCNPELVESMGACAGHGGIPEAYCYQCTPALIPAFKAVGDWCAGHDRPESQCYICNPQLDPSNASRDAPVEPADGASLDPFLGRPDNDGGFASRTQRPPAVYCSTQGLIVRLQNADISAQAGLELATVDIRPITKTVECNAEIAYDGRRHARIASQVPGIVSEVIRDFGDSVKAGEPLLTITSPHLGAAKAAYLQAGASVDLWESNHTREVGLLERGVSTEKDLLEAENHLAESRIALSEAEQALLGLGLASEEIQKVRRAEDTSGRYVVTAPFDAVVVDRLAAIGEVVDVSKTLMAVADVSRMWALLDVYESDLRDVRVGQPVVLNVEGLRGEPVAGHITWVSSHVDPRTRTLRARAELDNSHGMLRANMFAHASIGVRDRTPCLVVPESAVQWEGCCNVVFVKRSETEFEPRKVHLGVATGTLYEVLSGVEAGEEIVTEGSFLLKTEILKGSIGAGCCEVDPGA